MFSTNSKLFRGDKLKLEGNKVQIISGDSDNEVAVIRPASIELITTNDSLGRMITQIYVVGVSRPFNVPCLRDGTEPNFEIYERAFFGSKNPSDTETPVEFASPQDSLIIYRYYNGLLSCRIIKDNEDSEYAYQGFWIVRLASVSLNIRQTDENIYRIDLSFHNSTYTLTANEELLAAILKAYEST